MKISYVVLYLEDTVKAKDFWVNKLGFIVKDENTFNDLTVYKVGKEGDYTNFELVPLKFMENNPHDLNLGIPSIAFETEDLENEHEALKEKGVKVADIGTHGGIKSFAFFDSEDNAFAVIEK